jgi:transcriptional regulator with XRE-family HTH domain
MVSVRGVWTPDIKWNRLEKLVLLLLAHHPVELTGNQIRFIRHSMEMNQREFSGLFGISHAAVVKWEKSHDKPAKMQITTQIAIRLHILDDLIKDDKEFRIAYHNITSLAFQNTAEPLEIDTQTDLIAI